jgi:hypothetical protein
MLGSLWERREMPQSANGMLATLLLKATWKKSRHSNPSGDCVELAKLTGGRIAVRNSRHPNGPTLLYPHAAMAAFLRVVKEGELDEMTR